MGDDDRTDEHEDAPDDEQQQDAETDADDEPETEEEQPPRKKPKQRPERQAAAYRVQRNEARRDRDALQTERDELRVELAFTRAAGSRFVDLDAAWKLLDRAQVSIDVDGTPIGVQEAVDGIAEAHPFLLTPDAEPPEKETDPFKTATGRSSGRVMNGKKKPLNTGLSRSALEQKYPALRRGR